jgi:RimJ/RimL family protein N-acetyltransferase
MTALPLVVLEGRHVRLEPLTLEHADALTGIATGPRETFALTFVPETAEDVDRYVRAVLREHGEGLALPFVIVRTADARVVGCTRLGHVERWDWPEAPADRGVIDAAEIGWTWLAEDVQRTGINTESKRLLLAHAFDTLGAQRITLISDARNARSRRAIEGLGAHLDGVLRSHFPARDGTIRDTATYSILRSEWPSVRDRLDARLDLRR